jgi:hypothetical protein
LDVNDTHYHLITNEEKQGILMIRKIYGRIAAGTLLLAAMSLLLPLTASAQDADVSYNQVRTVHVKTSKVGEFVELQKQFKAALEAAGRPARAVWQEIRGDQSVFHLVVRADNLTSLDTQFERPMEDDVWDEYVGALSDTISSNTRVIVRRYPGLSIPRDGDAAPSMLVVRSTLVAPGKGAAYRNWQRDHLVPALKAGGATGRGFSKVVYGGNTDRHISTSLIDNWAQLDGPGPIGEMSDEDRNAMFAALDEGTVWESDVRIMRFRGDLSHRSPPEE